MSLWLVVVEGATEMGGAGYIGVLEELLDRLFEDEDAELAGALGCGEWEAVEAPELEFVHGARLSQFVPNRVLRKPLPKGMAKLVARALHYGRSYDAVIFLVDNDHDDPRRSEVEGAFAACHRPHAWGVAKEMVEAWLIADADLLSPVGFDTRGKRPEDLWGDPHNSQSGHPKRVFIRACSEARLSPPEARERWCLTRAAPNSPSLREFCVRVVDLLRDRSLCTPIAWD